ncbi:TupA-like ATPgrasp [Acidaminococcus fermentans]|uniref:TupA-like ATPgrasp n=2 Tax=Acidaminococcus fermentans TaxID=905 RepID=A0A1H2ZRP8_ACIFE|nr:TupA-like ATPgrasp [Acidaminococcus fermentans]
MRKGHIMLKQIYSQVLSAITYTTGIDNAKKFDTRLRFHKSLNLTQPKTLADKVSYIELHESSHLAVQCTDKYAVRQYIADKIEDGTKLLVPLAGGPWDDVDKIDFDKLPSSFVLKATHGCKMNYFVPDKTKLDIRECKAEMKRWLGTTYGTYSVEPHYGKIPHRIYAEQYLEEMSDLVDYKIHCLNGEPQFILVITDRIFKKDEPMKCTLDLFDIHWNPIPEIIKSNSEIPGKGNVPKPENLEEMVCIAKQLSQDFKFVRVDLYNLHGKVLFGELTFSPACCVFPYFTEKFNEMMGDKLRL